jgi:hypothetical protein
MRRSPSPAGTRRARVVGVPASGLGACLGLAFWVETAIWLAGLGLIAVGLVWHTVAVRGGG